MITNLTSQQQTLNSQKTLEDTPPDAPISPRFSTDAGISNTVVVASSVINTDDRQEAAAIPSNAIRVGGSVIVNPNMPVYPPVFDDPREGPPIEGSTEYTFQPGHPPVPTIP